MSHLRPLDATCNILVYVITSRINVLNYCGSLLLITNFKSKLDNDKLRKKGCSLYILNI